MIRTKTRPVKICTGKRNGEKIKVRDLIKKPRLFSPDAVVPDKTTKKKDYKIIVLQKNIRIITANKTTFKQQNLLLKNDAKPFDTKIEQVKRDSFKIHEHDYCLPLSKEDLSNQDDLDSVSRKNKLPTFSPITEGKDDQVWPLMTFDDILSYGLINYIEDEEQVQCEIEKFNENHIFLINIEDEKDVDFCIESSRFL